MDRAVAEQVQAVALECVAKLIKSIGVVEHDAPDELKEYRRAVGWVLSEIDDRILQPIYAQHPQLEPEGQRREPGGQDPR
jgi:hypothetical protein